MHEVPDEHLDELTELREICLQTLRGFKESTEFGMPSYSQHGQVAVAWNCNKDGIQLQIANDSILKKFKSQLKHLDINKSTIRFKHLNPENLETIKTILEEVHAPQPANV